MSRSFWPIYTKMPDPIKEVVQHYSRRFHIDKAFIWSVMRTESRFEPDIKSPAGAIGLMQIWVTNAELPTPKAWGLGVGTGRSAARAAAEKPVLAADDKKADGVFYQDIAQRGVSVLHKSDQIGALDG